MTKRERWIVIGLVALWALIYLPNLRSNPNWYGDEGEWMEKSWQLIHGKLRVGPVVDDFIYPYPYPPLYMLLNGALLRTFGNDVVVGRALGAVTALAAAAILFWIGCRLRDRLFGFFCAAAFLVSTEAVPNFRWVRSHPMAGVFALASIGFLVRYVQQKRLRDAVWAGAFCSLATATNYFTYPLAAAVVLTVAISNWRKWPHILAAAAASGSYAVLFVIWYSATFGLPQLVNHVQLLTSIAANEVRPTLSGEIARFTSNVLTLGFRTPTRMVIERGPEGRDWWLVIATLGFLWLPVTKNKWLRAWLPFWLLVLMYGVFKKLNNVSLFFYPATIFLPLMSVGFAGVLTWAGEGWRRLGAPGGRVVPGIVGCVLFGFVTVRQAFTQFETKIEPWTQQSIPDAEAVMQFVNDHTTSNDFVIVPKQIYWLVKNAGRKSMLTYCARYQGIDNDMPVPTHIPRELFWFDCRLENAKYVVMEYGARELVFPDGRKAQLPVGIDAVYTVPVLRGVREIVRQMQEEKWPVVLGKGAYIVLANPRFVGKSNDGVNEAGK